MQFSINPVPRLSFAFPADSMWTRLFVTGFAIFLILPLHAGHAQSVREGKQHFFKGEYEKAISLLDRRRHTLESLLWLTYAYQETGELERAKGAITQTRRWTAYPALVNRMGELEYAMANYSKAYDHFVRAFEQDSTYLEARLNLGKFEANWGRKERARNLLDEFITLYKTTPYPDARLSFTTAQACIYLNRFEDSNDLFQDASKQQPDDWRIFVHWGNLFLDKYNFADAIATFKDALKLNPHAADAKIGIARARENGDAQNNPALIATLLETFPRRLDVLNYATHWSIERGDRANAEKYLKKALELGEHNLETMTLQAKLELLAKDTEGFERIAAKILKINPAYSKVYTEAGNLLARRYLFTEAVGMYRKALRLNAEDAAAHGGLGTTLSRLAKLEEARPELEKAFQLDGYNLWTGNLLNLFDSYKEYRSITTEHFIIRLHRDDVDIVGPYAAELAEAAYAALVPRYGVQLDFKVAIEIFPKHDDFAVRCFGLPGSQSFLGICFGPLITMNSPRARPVGSFNWAETLWHEFAHVVHLTLTHNRVPRWLAEGISVYEATAANRSWDMNMQLAMAGAIEHDKIIPLSELDAGFVGDPRRVTFSYYQASQMVSFIVEKFGFASLLELLNAFRDEQETSKAVKSVLRLAPSAFDREFAAFLEKKFIKANVDLTWEVEKLPQEPAARVRKLNEMARKNPKSFFAKLQLGHAYLAQKSYSDAVVAFEAARQLYPEYVAEDGPDLALATAYLALGDSSAAIARLSAFLDYNGKNYRAAMQLYELAESTGDTDAAMKALETAIFISPYSAKMHKQLGEIYLSKHQAARATREFRVELALDPVDKAGAHCRLAEALLAENKKSEAKKHALLALEIAPTFTRAQEILLSTVQ